MRNGLRIFDADTHGGPCAEVLEPYLDAIVRERVPELDKHKRPITVGLAGEVREAPYKHNFSFRQGGGWSRDEARVLGEAEPRSGQRHFQQFMGAKFPTEGGVWDAAIRLRDMDEEGVDTQLVVTGGANGHADPEVEMAFIRAEHRFMHDFCSADPRRLKSMIDVTPRSVEASLAEIKRWAREPWAVAVRPTLPLDYPADHPDLEPIWQAAEEAGLCVVHHSFSMGYPGYRDLWQNPFLGRMASHPWAAQRFVAAMFCSGILDRYPNLRVAVLESGFGWLPFWAKRMDDQVHYVGYVADLKQTPSEYMTGGRFFASIVLHEGPDMLEMVSRMLGDQVLMFGSDYPHAESRFPNSVDQVLGWENVSLEQMRKLMWDNAVRAFGEP
ncbi:MAG: amidohydrolase [Chloroflexi bacterium]|nr:amidohydrolase [Chloroflexota bacterium]